MNARCGDCRMARGDRDLVQVRYHVAGCIQAGNRGLLVLINLEQPDSVVSAPR